MVIEDLAIKKVQVVSSTEVHNSYLIHFRASTDSERIKRQLEFICAIQTKMDIRSMKHNQEKHSESFTALQQNSIEDFMASLKLYGLMELALYSYSELLTSLSI